MKKEENASISIKKIICMTMILVLLSGIGVMAGSSELQDVTIVLENGYEMKTVTTNYKVVDILKENNIILDENQKTVPDLEAEVETDSVIRIVDETYEVIEVANISKENIDVSFDELLKSYEPITEKIVVEEESIPFETITKEVENKTAGSSTTNKVIQEGKDGVKELTYKVKYQSGVEVEKVLISEIVKEESVDKIIQVQEVLTTRSTSVIRTSSSTWTYSDEELDLLCALTAQECNSSYAGALAVITTACNRTQSKAWSSNGSDPLSQFKAQGQFCYSIDSYWKKRLNGNYPSYVKQAVVDALSGVRNHTYLSFRAAGTASGEYIGGNVYFNSL